MNPDAPVVMVGCPICGKKLPIDFFECPDCGCRNPQLQLVKREVLRISFAPEIIHSMKQMSIKRGWSLHRFANEAVEYYLTGIAMGRVRGFQ